MTTSIQKSCLEYCPQSYQVTLTEKQEVIPIDELHMTTFNGALLPPLVNKAQKIFTLVKDSVKSALVSQTLSTIHQVLDPPLERANRIAKHLSTLDNHILSGQEIFCEESTDALITSLKKTHTIVHRAGNTTLVNSGLFFASPFKVEQEGICFWSFSNLSFKGGDVLCNKGVLRVPVHIPHQKENKPVIFYTVHLQSQEEGASIRAQQLKDISALISKDQKLNPSCPIFLMGDLNITDVEPGGRVTLEHSNLGKGVFSNFHDFYFVDHDSEGKRTKAESRYLSKDGASTLCEPTGSFYAIEEFGSGKVEHKTRYDYCLLYRANKTFGYQINSHTEIRRLMEKDKLSDHLPLTTSVNLTTLLKHWT